MKNYQIAECDKKSTAKPSGLYTDKQHKIRMQQIYSSINREEQLEDELLEVKSFLIATRDGHYHKLTTDEAIERLEKVMAYLRRVELCKTL